MQPFAYCLAFGPIAIYLLLVGSINLRRRPLVVSGSRELAALGVAVLGLLVVGPMQLFVPDATALRFGWLIWPLLLSFYGLSLTLWMLIARPRLVVYNIRGAQLRPVLSELAIGLDPEARWAGDSLALPQLGVQLRIEGFGSMRNVSLVANSDAQSFSGWRRLERSLRSVLRGVEVSPNPRGVGMVAAGALILSSLVFRVATDPQLVAQGFFDLLNR
ncbi:MAG TPA: hypothetical protein VG433_03090 [Pirellulales bacterium]|jgi:hypothetical protein|nr:hypothetical protein [Pirellulales bacterium]